MTKDIKFSTMLLYVDGEPPTPDFFREIVANGKKVYEQNGINYIIDFDYSSDRKYFWMSCEYGNALPYNDQVLDIATEELIVNPRERNQVEAREQVFAFYSMTKQTLYLSNSLKMNLLKQYMADSSNVEEVDIKRIFVSIDEFLAKIRSVNSVSLIMGRNLLSTNTYLFEETRDTFGMGDPEQLTLKMDYGYVDITQRFKEKFKDWFQKAEKGYARNLFCVGRDDSGMDAVFKMGNFENQIEVRAEVNANGMIETTSLKMNILEKLAV